ncbi:MAG: hypothetical protein AAGA54_03850 [Myxococcota bacterium]
MSATIERPALHVAIRHRADAVAVASMVRALIRSAGGSDIQASAAATATAELAQNIVSHAGGDGELDAWIEGADVVIRARDRGPSPRLRGRGLGQGRAAVERLMDRVEVTTNAEGGLVVTTRTCIAPRRSAAWT